MSVFIRILIVKSAFRMTGGAQSVCSALRPINYTGIWGQLETSLGVDRKMFLSPHVQVRVAPKS